MPYYQLKHSKLYYEEYGDKAGTPILSIHGLTCDSRLMIGCMEPCFNDLSGYRRIYLDLPGMGKTEEFDSSIIDSSDAMLETLVEFTKNFFGNQSFYLAGESYGAYLCQGLIRKGCPVKGAVFICPVVEADSSKRTVPRHQVMEVDESFVSRLSPAEYQDFSRDCVVLNETVYSRYLNEIQAGIQISNSPFIKRLKENYNFSFSVTEGSYDFPAMFLLGKQDAVVGYKDALELSDNYHSASFHVLQAAGHNLQIEQADMFTFLVRNWISKYVK